MSDFARKTSLSTMISLYKSMMRSMKTFYTGTWPFYLRFSALNLFVTHETCHTRQAFSPNFIASNGPNDCFGWKEFVNCSNPHRWHNLLTGLTEITTPFEAPVCLKQRYNCNNEIIAPSLLQKRCPNQIRGKILFCFWKNYLIFRQIALSAQLK